MFVKNRAKFRPYIPDKLTHFFPDPVDSVGGVTERTYNLFLALQAVSPTKLIVTSGYRTQAHNAEVGGAPHSAHLVGKALDIAVDSDRERFILIRHALELQVTRIGIYPGHVHIDVDTENPQHVIWLGE